MKKRKLFPTPEIKQFYFISWQNHETKTIIIHTGITLLSYYIILQQKKKNYGKKIGLNSMQQNQGGTPKVIPDL